MITSALLCLTLTVFHEARGESEVGQAAVAQTVINRTKDERFPKTVCKVVHQPSAYSWTLQRNKAAEKKERESWDKSLEIAKIALQNGNRYKRIIGDATHYHKVGEKPKWSRSPKMKKIGKVGKHIFYIEKLSKR